MTIALRRDEGRNPGERSNFRFDRSRVAISGHRFWPDDVAPAEAKLFTSAALVGHRQVTDAYPVASAQHHKGKFATFDRGVAELIQVHKERPQYITLVEA